MVDPRSDEVGRHEIGCELDPLELAADRAGQRLDREGLGQARNAFDEEVTSGQHGDRHPLEQHVLTDDGALDLEQHRLERVRCHGFPSLDDSTWSAPVPFTAVDRRPVRGPSPARAMPIGTANPMPANASSRPGSAIETTTPTTSP